MEKIHVLGTGNAMVTQCFNTCYLLEMEKGNLLVDCGGGNGILRQLKAAGFDPASVHQIFLTHEHCDHLTGIVWMVRAVATAMNKGKYQGELHIYCHSGLEPMVRTICGFMLQKKMTAHFDERILFHVVEDGQREEICGHIFTFFDIRSTKAPQFAFLAGLECGRLAFMGDEPVNPACEEYAKGAQWLLSEAFCLDEEAEKFKPHDAGHLPGTAPRRTRPNWPSGWGPKIWYSGIPRRATLPTARPDTPPRRPGILRAASMCPMTWM